MNVLSTVASNTVQAIGAFRVSDLQVEAASLGQHFLHAYCLEDNNKQQVLARIASALALPVQSVKNFDALSDCLTDMNVEAAPQAGFVFVLEQLPVTEKFDREARAVLLDVFRDAARFWAEKQVAFRVFYSFA